MKSAPSRLIQEYANSHSDWVRDLVIITCVFFSADQMVRVLPESWIHYGLCAPAAHMGSFILGVPAVEFNKFGTIIWVLPHPSLDIHLGRECSGLGFGTLSLTLIAWGSLRHLGLSGRWILIFLASLPVTYVLTLMINGIRVITVFHARLLSQEYLPESYWSATHALSGALVFLTSLILIHISYDYIKQHTKQFLRAW